jgi:uncharacterized caspase-like protein
MKKMSRILLLFLFFNIFLYPLFANDKWAVIVGINNYKHSGIKDLHGCVNDARGAKEILVKKHGFPESNITFLTDDEATRQNIIESLKIWLPQRVADGDIAVFYYSGHGSNANDDNGDEEDGLDETIVPSDRNTTDSQGKKVPDIRDDELAETFKELRAKGATVTVFLDSCHAGTGIRALQGKPFASIRFAPPINMEGRAPVYWPSSKEQTSGDEEVVMDGVSLIAGCRADQSSLEYRIGEDYHGLMSYFLTKGLEGSADENGDKEITYQELWKYSSEKVKEFIRDEMEDKYEQDIQLETSNPLAIIFENLSAATQKQLTIKGAVLDTLGRRVPNALVGFLPLGERSITRETLITYARTDEKGTFVTVGTMKPGKYSIKVVCQGYQTLWQDIDIVESNVPGVAFIKIVMKLEM